MRFADRERELQRQAQPAPKPVEEQEAERDQVADLASAVGSNAIQRVARSPEEQQAGAAAQLSANAPMSLARFRMEEALGAEAGSGVRGGLEAEAADLGPRAYLGGGMDTGQELIGHELPHVVQQQGGVAQSPEALADEGAQNREAREARMAAMGEGEEAEVEGGAEGGGGAAEPYLESTPSAEGAAPASPYAESSVPVEEQEQ